MKSGQFRRSETLGSVSSTTTRTVEGKFQRYFTEHGFGLVGFLMHRMLTPTDTSHTLVYVCGSLNTTLQKKPSMIADLIPPRTLPPLPHIKVCLYLWGNFADPIPTSHIAHTWLYHMSSVEAGCCAKTQIIHWPPLICSTNNCSDTVRFNYAG